MQRFGIGLLACGLVAVAAAYGATLLDVGSTQAPWWLASGTIAVLGALAVLGAGGGRRPTPILTATLLVSFGSLAAGLLIPLALPAPVAGAPLVFGLPRPTALLIALVYGVPLVVMPLGYAAAFDREVLPPDELARLREPQ
jgi:hypothetical protein